jgi:hypothetical protein
MLDGGVEESFEGLKKGTVAPSSSIEVIRFLND